MLIFRSGRDSLYPRSLQLAPGLKLEVFCVLDERGTFLVENSLVLYVLASNGFRTLRESAAGTPS